MASSLDDKTFILGIGAQKAGTSWLFKYFDRRDDCYMSPIKELHYFDTKHRPDLCGTFHAKFVKQLVARVRDGTVGEYESDERLRALIDRVSMMYDDSAYRRYFEDRVSDGVKCFGEFSPSYSLLNRGGFADARAQFPNIRVIFLLRDPVERYYSLMRMKQRKGVVVSASQSFAEMLDDPAAVERGAYHETIRNLDQVFDSHEVYITFYEQLFQDEELRKICDFVGLPFEPGQYERRVNPGNEIEKLSPAQTAMARDRFAVVYDFCRKRFDEALPVSWHA